MNRKKMLIATLAIALLIGTVSAALLTYYGQITGTVTVGQAVKLDGLGVPGSLGIIETKSGVAGLILGDTHNLVNYADKKIMVNLVSTGINCPYNDWSGVAVYPEYGLNAMVDDDALFVVLNDYITWQDFGGLSFDYLITYDGGNNWIPQCNLALRDSEGTVKYFASWVSRETGITGTTDVRTSITYDKGDFLIYYTDWSHIGFWRDVKAYPGWVAELKDLRFKYFVMQAGDTVNDPNPTGAKQIAWLSKFTTAYRTVVGIALPTPTMWDAASRLVEFRMVYDFAYDIYPGDYTVKTDVVPLGFGP